MSGPEADIAALTPVLRALGADVVWEESIESWYVHHTSLDGPGYNEAAVDLMDVARGLYLAASGRKVKVNTWGHMVLQPDAARTHHLTLNESVPVTDSVAIANVGPGGARSEPGDAALAAAAGLVNPHLAKAARLLARQGDSWMGLYKVHECIRDAKFDVVKSGVCSKAQLSRFTHTANSFAAIGDDARHASVDGTAPNSPMSLAPARAFVQKLLLAAATAVGKRAG